MKNIALILDRHDVFDSLISFVIKEKKNIIKIATISKSPA